VINPTIASEEEEKKKKKKEERRSLKSVQQKVVR
jgi:hypothetical protein